MKHVQHFLLLLLIFSACEEKADIALSGEETGLLVVEGVLTNERKNHLIKLSLPHLQPNGEVVPATGASVFISQDSVYALTEFPAGSGRYYTPVGRAVSGKMYTLIIRYNGKQYMAQDGSVPVEPLQELKYRQTAGGYELVMNETGSEPYYIEHRVTWQHTDACDPAELCDGYVVFYDLKTVDVNEIHKPEKAPFIFPERSIVVRRKYSVSPGYKTFLRSMLSETEWRGGVFDVQRADVATNLSEGAVGFFAVTTVVSDTTVVR